MNRLSPISKASTVAALLVASGTAQAAVTSLPTAPDGFQWQLHTANLTDTAIADTTAAEDAMEFALSLSGSSSPPFSTGASNTQSLSLNAFGSAEPSTYVAGDFIDVVTANDISASFAIFASAGVLNPDGDFIFVESALNGVQITSPVGNTLPGSDLADALADTSVILASPTANESVALNTSFGEVEGEAISFSFSAADSFEFSKPFGGTGTTEVQYFVNPSVNMSLRRDTTYTRFELITNAAAGGGVPEPSGVMLVCLSAVSCLIRRR